MVRGKRREEGRGGLDKKQMSDVASTTSVGRGTDTRYCRYVLTGWPVMEAFGKVPRDERARLGRVWAVAWSSPLDRYSATAAQTSS